MLVLQDGTCDHGFLNLQDGTCNHDVLNQEGGTCNHGMLKLVGDTGVESHLQYKGPQCDLTKESIIFVSCLVVVSLSWYTCVSEWVYVSISCTSLLMGCCCKVRNFMGSVRWFGDPLFLGNDTIARQYACGRACLFFTGVQTGVPPAYAVACPDITEFQAHMPIRMDRAS